MSDIELCPKCRCKDVRILTEHFSGQMTIHCPKCGLHHQLKVKLPCVPEEIIEEWNAFCRVQKRISGDSR